MRNVSGKRYRKQCIENKITKTIKTDVKKGKDNQYLPLFIMLSVTITLLKHRPQALILYERIIMLETINFHQSSHLAAPYSLTPK